MPLQTMIQAPIAGQPVDVPPTRRLRQPWPPDQESLRWNEDLVEKAMAALSKEVGNDMAQALITAMVARSVASAMYARLVGSRTSALQRFERRLRKSVDTFNRRFG